MARVATEFQGNNLPASMVLPVHGSGKNVSAPKRGTSVLPPRNVRTIGQPDRWWENCFVGASVSPLDVWSGRWADAVGKLPTSLTCNALIGK